MTTSDSRRKRAMALQLHGVLAHWAECAEQPWLEPLLAWEESERSRRSLERRLRYAHIGRFKPLADFDWNWPEQCDQAAIAELMTLDFLHSATNAILVGPSGMGKTTIHRPEHRTSGDVARAYGSLRHRRPVARRAGLPRQ